MSNKSLSVKGLKALTLGVCKYHILELNYWVYNASCCLGTGDNPLILFIDFFNMR